MQKILFILIVILLMPHIVQAEILDIKLSKEQYSPGETVTAEINVNSPLSRDLQISDFKLFSQSQNIQISLMRIKINSTLYYVSFDMPNTLPGEYEFGAYDVFYNADGVSKKITIKKQIQINDNKETILSFKPVTYTGILKDIEESPFTITLKNNGQNEINVLLSTLSNFLKISPSVVSLNPGSSKIISIQTTTFNKNENYFNGNIKIDYAGKTENVKVILYKQLKEQIDNVENITVPEKKIANLTLTNTLGVPINYIELELDSNKQKIIDFNILNIGNSDASNISLVVDSDYISAIPSNIENIIAGSNYPISLEINSQKNIRNNVTSSLEINYGENMVLIPIKIITNFIVKENITTVKNDTNVIQPPITESPNKDSSVAFILAFSIIILIVIILLIYAYKKIKPEQEEFNQFI